MNAVLGILSLTIPLTRGCWDAQYCYLMFNQLLLFGATSLAVISGFLISKIEKKGPNWITLFVGIAIFSPFMIGGFSWYEEAFCLGFVVGSR